MMTSSASIRPASSSTTAPVMEAGIITQAARGGVSFWTNSSSVGAPVAPSAARPAIASALVS